MINIAYLQNSITTGFLHLEQNLTQQTPLGWIRVSNTADVNIYYKPSSPKIFADRGITQDFPSSLTLEATSVCDFPETQTKDFFFNFLYNSH